MYIIKVVLALFAIWFLFAFINLQPQTIKAEVKATDYGAVCDGVTDDTTSIQNALNSAQRVLLPSGTCVVTASLPQTYRLLLNSNNQLIGEGNSTIIKCVGGSEHNVIQITGSNNVTISNLQLDGNNICGHLIRGGSNNGVNINNVRLVNGRNYGIGLQEGTLQNIFIDSISIENVGSDGIDFKNINGENKNIFLSNISIKNMGQIYTDKAAIDIRGIASLNNIQITGLHEQNTGIRFREDSTSTGLGGSYSTLTNFYVEGNAQYGVYVPGNYVQISNGVVEGTFYNSVNLTGIFNQVNNIFTINGLTGFYVSDLASYSKISNSTARTGGVGFDIRGDNVVLNGITGSGLSSNGIKIATTADLTLVDSSFFKSNGAGSSKLGTNLITGNNFGF